MIRTQIQLDESTYALAKQRAFAEKKSLAAVAREALTQYLRPTGELSGVLEELTFIASGQSSPDGPVPLSERHDEALAEDFSR